MPTYEYYCEKCEQQLEIFQSMKDPPLKVCPKDRCTQKTWGKGKIKKLIGAGAGLIFKGSGFYITDYRSDKYKEAAKKESGAGKTDSKTAESKSTPPATGASSTSGSGGKTESKPAKPAKSSE